MDKTSKQQKFKLQDMAFYFDAVERDRLDSAGWDRRSGEVLALRERLLRLPTPAFEATMRTIRNVVTDANTDQDQDDAASRSARRRQGNALFEQVKTSTARTARIDKVN